MRVSTGKTSRKRKMIKNQSIDEKKKKLRSNSTVEEFSKTICKTNDLFDS